MDDFYQILEIPIDATQEQVKQAYRRAAMKWHPDRRPEHLRAESAEKFQKIQQAYDTLSNTISRQQYNIKRQQQTLHPNVDPSWFETTMRHEQKRTPPEDKISPINILFSLADLGVVANIQGESVRVPKGSAQEGAIIRHNQDKYFRLHITYPKGVSREGNDLVIEAQLPLPIAIVGGAMQFQHWDGRKFLVEWPANSFEGKRLRLKNCGPLDADGNHGHLYFVSKIVYNNFSDFEIEKIKQIFPPFDPLQNSPKWSN